MSLKRFLSFSLPLIIMLFSFSIYVSISKMIDKYEMTINSDYSIVIVTAAPIVEDDIKRLTSIDLKEMKVLSRENILKDLKNEVTEGSFTLLQVKLPYFYTLSLNEFPTSSKLERIKKELLTVSGMKSVETFSKDHDNVYSLFLFIKTVSMTMFVFMVIFTLFIIANQINIWFYEHYERLQIINLHGGSLLYGAKPIIKLALFSGIFAGVLVLFAVYYIDQNVDVIFSPEIAKIITQNKIEYTIFEASSVVLLSLFISFITVFGVLIKNRFK
ncbi:MAG: cell division protein FtsX [Arcobacteraceae bacterium]|nr:cell division protein FtsX [Arcobacteraceae bacterium]